MKRLLTIASVILILIFAFQTAKSQCPAPIPFSMSLSATTSICEASGTIVATINGGSAPYFYQITNGPIVTPLQGAPLFEALPAGTYTVEATDFCNTTVSESVTVPGNYQVPNLTFTTTDVECPNAGEIIISASGGLPSYQYRAIVTSANPPDTIGFQSSNIFSGLESGSYQVQVLDQCNNFQTRSLTILDKPLSNLVLILSRKEVVDCDEFVVGLTTDAVLPAFGNLIESTSNDTIWTGYLYTNDTCFTVSDYGTYVMKLTDSCERQKTSTRPFYPTVIGSVNTTCDSISVNLLSYYFNDSLTYELISGPVTFPPQDSPIFNDLPNGNYVFQVTDRCGAVVTFSVNQGTS